MRKQVVRAGKCFSVGFILIVALLVLFPWLFLLSFFGFAFLLPMGCALAGLLYLRNYAVILYGKLSTANSLGAPSQALRVASAPRIDATFTEFFTKDDSQEIESLVGVDEEIDAVLVITAPREMPESEDADDGNGSRAVPVAGIPAENGTGRERTDGGEQLAEEDRWGSPAVRSFVEEFAAEENSAYTGRRSEEQEGGSPEQLSKGDVKSRPAHDTSVHDQSSGSVIGNITGGVEEGEKTEEDRLAVADAVDSADEGYACIGKEKGAVERSSTEDLIKSSEGRTDSTIAERGKDIQGETPEVDPGEENVVEKSALFGNKANESVDTYPSVDTHEKSFETVFDGEKISGAKEMEGESKEEQFEALPGNGPHSNKEWGGTDLPPTRGKKAGNERIGATSNGRALREVDEDQERQNGSPIAPGVNEAEKERIETLSNEKAPREADEDQERQDFSPIAPVSTSGAPYEVEEEVSTKPDTNEAHCARNFLLDQAHEDDTRICRECGWKCANARPSAKTRRNHKKHCKLLGLTTSAPKAGMSATEPPPDLDHLILPIKASVKMETDSKTAPPPDSTPEQFEDGSTGENEQISNTESDAKGDNSEGALEYCLELTKEADEESIHPEDGSASPDNLHSEASRDELGSSKQQSSSSPTEENSHCLQSPSPQLQNDDSVRNLEPVSDKSVAFDDINDDSVRHLEPVSDKSVAFDDTTPTAVPSGHDDESGSAKVSESIHSEPDEFPDARGPWSSFPPDKGDFDHEQDQLAQLLQFWRNTESEAAHPHGDPKPARMELAWKRRGTIT